MKMQKRIISILLAMAVLFVSVLSLCACGSQEAKKDPNTFMVYYTNQNANDIIYQEQKIEGAESMEQVVLIQTLLDLMFTQNEEDTTYYTAKPDNVSLQGIVVKDGLVTLDFSSSYLRMTNVREILLRASVVSTLCQVPGVTGVAFTVDQNPITNSNGDLIGTMTNESFVNVLLTEEGMLKQETDLTIYFADNNKEKLVPSVYRFTIDNSNSSMEEYIMNRLLEGPAEPDVGRTVAQGVTLNSVVTTDHVCYLNFGKDFLEQEQPVSDELMIYSIVNSLCQLTYVYSVKFLIDGTDAGMLHEAFDLSKPLAPDSSYIQIN